MTERLRRHRRTKIIATVGPACATPEMLGNLFLAGADVFRLNFSHGSHETHATVIEMIRALEKKYRRPIGILADVQGPKLRVGRFQSGRVQLQAGQTFTLDMNPAPGDTRRVCLPHPETAPARHPQAGRPSADRGDEWRRFVRPQGRQHSGRGAAHPRADGKGFVRPRLRAAIGR